MLPSTAAATLPGPPFGLWAQNHHGAIFAALLAFRMANALTLRTFFQPDEFFQSLEVAIDLAFGPASGACITWEWENHLRSSLHPAIFAAVYRAASWLAYVCGLKLSTRADLLLVAPKVLQALFAALLDWYTWKLAETAYGRASRTALSAVSNPISNIPPPVSRVSSSDSCCCVMIARALRLLPVAMVLFNTNPVQLS